MRSTVTALALWLLAAATPSFAAIEEDDLLPVEQAFVPSATAVAPDRIEVRWRIAPGYYLYRHRMSAQSADAAYTVESLDLPPGTASVDEFFGEVETYRDQLTTRVLGVPAEGATQATLQLRYQGCADVGVCYPPHQQTVTVALPAASAAAAPAPSALPLGVQTGSNPLAQALGSPALPAAGTDSLPLPEEQAFGFDAIASSAGGLLLRFTPAPGYYLYRDRSSFRLVDADGVGLGAPQWPEGSAHEDEHFGKVVVYFDQVEVPLPIGRSHGAAQTVTLEATFQGCQTDGICYPPMTRRVPIALPAADPASLQAVPDAAAAGAPSAASKAVPLWLALLLALGGGLILNLMPCVLPVLSLKALGLASSGESHAKARAHALWYTAGVLASFAALGALALGLRAAGIALGWGFQLQQPAVVAALVYLMFAIGLNLSGVFQIGAGLAGAGQSLTQKSGPAGDFFTGVLAVVVASPCTAPFMGTALAFAFAASPVVAIAVFLALGLGLALPFLLIGFVPALAARLPRPGAWMDTFKQALAFPMYLTAIWLLWVLGQQRGVDAVGIALVGLTVFAAGLWLWGRMGLRRTRLASLIAAALLALGLYGIVVVARQPAATPAAAQAAEGDSVAYDADRLAALRAEGRTVFVNMTADWCVTCKANEKRVLDTDAFRDLLAARDAVYMKGDWTNVDPAITAFLEAHGAVGVPLYVVFRPGDAQGSVLPTVLTQDAVAAALQPAGAAP